MEEMGTFGDLLSNYRKRTKDSQNNQKSLSQKRFSQELETLGGFSFTYGTVSGWERNIIQIAPDSRLLLLTILRVLFRYKGLNQLEEANELLRLGGHMPLNDAEAAKLNPGWQRTKPITYRMKVASHEIQRAALPQLLALQGKDGVIMALDQQLTEENGAQVIFLSGRGGVGKSAVATALAHSHLKSNKFEGVAWIPFNLSDDQPAETVLEQLTLRLGRWLQVNHIDEATAAGREEMIRGALEAKPHLVIIDGVEALPHTDALNETLSQMVGQSAFLVTSRTVPAIVGQTFVYDLDEIGVDESQELLVAQTNATNGVPAAEFTLEVAQKIHDSVGGHPLTLILFPQLLKQHGLDSLLSAIELGAEGKHAFIYQKVWEMLSPEAHRLIMGLCFFGGLGASKGTLQETCALTELELYQSIREIGRFGLLQTRGGLDEKTYNLHNLTIQYVQILVRGAAEQKPFIEAIKRVFGHWLTLFSDPQLTLPYEVVLQLQQSLRVSQVIHNDSMLSKSRTELLNTIFTPLKDHGFLNISESYWSFSIEHDALDDLRLQARLKNQLANIKQELREFPQALSLHQRALELGYQIEDSLEIARSHHHLSWCYYHMSDFKSAQEHNSLSISVITEFDLKDAELYKTFIRKGILSAKKGDYELAKMEFVDAITRLKKSNHEKYLPLAYQNLGYLYYLTDKYDEATNAYSEAKIYLELFPNIILRMKIDLAESALNLDHLRFEKTIEIIESMDMELLRNTRNYNILNAALGNLAQAYIELGKFDEANKLIDSSLLYWEETKQEFDYLLLLESRADILSKQGRLEESLELYRSIAFNLKKIPAEAKVEKLTQQIEKKIINLV